MTNRIQTSSQGAATDPRRLSTRGPKQFSRAATGLVLSLSLAAGLFIWFKLRVVTGMPRSAYADPDPQLIVPPPQATEPTQAAMYVEPRWAPDMEISTEIEKMPSDLPAHKDVPSR